MDRPSSRREDPQKNNTDNRFHYPQYKPSKMTPQPQPSPYSQASQYSQFPPHPSVRPPPGVKLTARQVPAGVGVAPTPTRGDTRERSPPQRSNGDGILVQDFRFPVARPPVLYPGSSTTRQSPGHQSPGRKANAHESYMSSVIGDFVTPGTTPGSRSRGWPAPRRYSGSVYAESEALGADERYQHSVSAEKSPPSSPEPSPQVLRQASVGKRAKPAVTTIKTRISHAENDPSGEAIAPVSRNAAMAALSAAIAAGVGKAPVDIRSETPGSRSYTPVRMPFDSSPPESPNADREFLRTPITPTTVASTMVLAQKPGSSHSGKSTNALLGLGIEQPSMSNKIPPNRRPPKLDIDAVREAENRGSTTSLSDLIKRATRLAANLDKGRTASRLGMLDMFGSQEKLNGNNRQSTMSDMISAFPAPAAGNTPTNRGDTQWPLGEKGEASASTTDMSKPTNQRRKCCGLSLPVFIVILIVVVVLIAAAVLVPIFLILVPRQQRKADALSQCAASFPCRNGGMSIVSNDACMCVCSGGFIGSQCTTTGNAADCTTLTLNQDNVEYTNATIGRSLVPVLSPQNRFGVPLNVSTILSLFSNKDLTCSSVNSLVNFNSTVVNQDRRAKRFIILPGLGPHVQDELPASEVRPTPPKITDRAAYVGDLRLERRQDGVTVGTSNGIVFQATSSTVDADTSSSTTAESSTVTSLDTGAPTDTPTSTSSDGPDDTDTPSPVISNNMTDEQMEFAQVVVMYVFQESRAVSVAVNAQQDIETFFALRNVTSSDETDLDVTLEYDDVQLTAKFGELDLLFANSTKVNSRR
ncbi:hypothetical protein B0A52_02184 [Exophiala mesophila]|uniref:EGF-like domain-containing protein n=1 Tax=Exophiala mesophila TaxID=212818 RepID=A0A438NBP2_EXOME|nr:hypothetical protein B0A52_02184 [Exophiala mesophila]